MRAVIQRVTAASVKIEEENFEKKILKGLVVLIGIKSDDTTKDADYLANKIPNLRLFPDQSGRFDKSVIDIDGEIMVISNFTVYGDAKKGRRPDFTVAASLQVARELYDYFVKKISLVFPKIQSGKFGAKMLVEIFNDGPVTLILDSE